MIWNEKMECMSRREMKDVQSERLRRIVSYVCKNCPPYKTKFDALGVTSGG